MSPAHYKVVIMWELDLYFLKSTEWGYFLIRNCVYGLVEDLEVRS